MSRRLCCYKQQQHSKLLAQFLFKVSTFRFNARTKSHAPLPDCRLNNALIQFVPSCRDTWTQFVDVLDASFSDIAGSLVVWIFMPKNSTITKFCHLALGGLAIMRHGVVTCREVQNARHQTFVIIARQILTDFHNNYFTGTFSCSRPKFATIWGESKANLCYA